MPARLARFSFICLFAADTVAAQSPQSGFSPENALNVVNVSIGDLSADGRWLVTQTSLRRDALGTDYRRDGDPTYLRPLSAQLWLIDTRSGASIPVFSDSKNVRSAALSPDAALLAVLVARDSVLEPVIWDRRTGKSRSLSLPPTLYVAENSDIRWTGDGRRVLIAVRSNAWRARVAQRFAEMTQGPVFVQRSSEPFLAWDDLRRQGNVRAIGTIEVATGRYTELLPEMMVESYQLTSDDGTLVYESDITRKTDYDVIFGTDARLVARQLRDGTTTEVLPLLKGINIQWSDDGRHYAYAKDGRIWLGALGEAARKIAGPDSGRADADTGSAARARRAAERFSLARIAPDGQAVLASNPKGYWVIDGAGSRTLVVESGDSLPSLPRYTPAAWTTDSRYIYLTRASRTAWQRGFARFDRQSGQLQQLVDDARLYTGLRVSRDGSTAVYQASDGNHPANVYATDAVLASPRAMSDANPQLTANQLARTQLVSYLDADGTTRYGVVYLPPDFTAGKRYPTLFNVYEDFFDDRFDATVNVLTANGYVVVKPSVGFEIGFPGEAWAKGVTAAANKLVELGIADSSKLGVFGTSYGGYAVNLLITQTHRFKAAVNISGKVDVVSFYTDSPRLGVRNVHAAEKSQDRLGATLWQQPQKYIANSAIFFADRITTPLLLMTGAQDSNVPADNTREMYYALRRLGKDVTWVDYMNSGHGTPGTTAAEFIDFHNRLLRFFGTHLKGEAEGTVVEAVSLLGDSLYRAVPGGTARDRMDSQLAAARLAYEHTPNDADSVIWLGRRTAYLGRFNDAIAIYTDGLARHPDDPRLYRHRGHRYLSVRKIDEAIADFEQATRLTRGKADEVEPDGQPNARNVPTSTLQSNTWYHLGLAYYLKGDYANALRAYREDLKVARNPDMTVATSHWLYMTLRRLGRQAEAARVLQPITPDMDIVENGAYHKLLLMYKGDGSPESLLAEGTGDLNDVTTAYGVGNWYLYNGRRADAERVFRRIVANTAQWASFGYLAAEADLRRLSSGGADAVTSGTAGRGR